MILPVRNKCRDFSSNDSHASYVAGPCRARTYIRTVRVSTYVLHAGSKAARSIQLQYNAYTYPTS